MSNQLSTRNVADWRDAVLSLWFAELSQADWFVANDDVDRDIIARFSQIHEDLAGHGSHVQCNTGRDALATIIVLDQFPRNMFRATPKAFASDVIALAISRDAVERQLDDGLIFHERQFLYMPHMHCEDAAVQASSVELFASLGDENTTEFAIRHKEIIDRFGRFPHRNAVLGRYSTPEETAFLEEPNSSF